MGVFMTEGRENEERDRVFGGESGAKPFKNSVLVSVPPVQGQATEISLQSSLFVAI